MDSKNTLKVSRPVSDDFKSIFVNLSQQNMFNL